MNNESGFSTTQTLHPGGTASAALTAYNGGNTTYDLLVRLERFNSTTGETGLQNAKSVHNGYVENLSLGGSMYTFDLLNDGKADYHNFAKGQTIDSAIDLSVPEDAAAGGNVSVTIGLDRGDSGPPSSVVKMHWEANAAPTNDSGKSCATCHDNDTVSTVHESKGASKGCGKCHKDSFKDAHMDCTSACHDGYPITGHGPNQEYGVVADFRCASNCHGGQQELAHRYLTNGTCQTCHGESIAVDAPDQPDTLMDMHGSMGRQRCQSCHGINSEGIHRPFTSEDCGACHPGSGGGGFDLGSFHDSTSDCASCHDTNNNKTIHDGATTDCAECHSNGYASHPTEDGSGEITGITRCLECHEDGNPDHENLDASESEIDCTQCHYDDNPS